MSQSVCAIMRWRRSGGMWKGAPGGGNGLLEPPPFPAGRETHHAGEHMDGLVLAQVVLEAEGVTLVDVQDLADVAVGVRPDELVSPGLLDADGLDRGHGQRAGITAAGLRSSRSTSRRKRLAASLSWNAPTRTRYQVPLAPRFASITYGFRPAPRARAPRRTAAARSCEAPTWTVKLPSSRGGGGSGAAVAGGTCTARSGGGTTVGCRGGEGTTDVARTGSGFSTRSWAFSAGASLTLPSAGREETAGDFGFRACASSGARSPAAAGACIEEIFFPSRIPSENTPARSSSAHSASATTCRSSRESSILSRSRSTSRTGAGVPDRGGCPLLLFRDRSVHPVRRTDPQHRQRVRQRLLPRPDQDQARVGLARVVSDHALRLLVLGVVAVA